MSERTIERAAKDFRARARELAAAALSRTNGVTAALEVAEYAAQLEARVLELQLAVGVDHLTRVKSRAAIEAFLDLELQRTARTAAPTSVLVVDVDHFKRVNDERGHAAGDEVLRAIGAALNSSRRATDAVGRVGGEEFVLVLSNSDELQAYHAAERIRQSIEALEFPGLPGLEVTASVGLAIARGATDREAFVARADVALYHAKSGGRNRVHVAA